MSFPGPASPPARPARRRPAPWLALAMASALAGGCAAVRAGVQLQDATDARDAAVERGSEELAPYEHTMSDRYLRKAWEEMGSREYKASVLLARKSAEWSDLALVQIERGPREVQVNLEQLPETTPEPPPDATREPEAPAVEPEAGVEPAPAPPAGGPIEPEAEPR